MRDNRFHILLLTGLACVLMHHSCSTCSRRQAVQDVTIDLAALVMDSTYVNLARKVVYALPTPIEMSLLIKNSGIPWRPALLNDPLNASRYLSSQKMALNFGVYITNLTYAGLFEQAQSVLRYKLAIQQLIEGLGLQSAINTGTMQALEDNINNKDMILQIISDTYAACTTLLDENDRYYLALTILIGGWIESMYIAASTLDENLIQNEDRIKQLVIDQILTFEMIWQVMSDFRDVPGIEELMNSLNGLAQLFDRIGIHQTTGVVSDATDGDISEISSFNVIEISSGDFERIKAQILILRHNFVNI